jgi:antirestriction protein
MEIKIYVASLKDYNAGHLVGEWIDLPTDAEEIKEVISKLSYGGQNDIAIHDYEAPFAIEEYESIYKLNEFAEQLEGIDDPTTQAHGTELIYAADVQAFAYELENKGLIRGSFEFVGDILDDEQVDDMVHEKIDNGGSWAEIKVFLTDAELTEDHHLLGGDGNIEQLTDKYLENKVHDLFEAARINI